MTEACVAMVEVHDRYNCPEHPFVGAAAVEVGLGPVDGPRVLVSRCKQADRVYGLHDNGPKEW